MKRTRTIALALVLCLPTLPGMAERLAFNAESGTITPPFVITNGCLCQFTSTQPGRGGQAAYGFALTNAGDYGVLALVNTPGGRTNSLYIGIDVEPSEPKMCWDIPAASGFTYQTVFWRENDGSAAGPTRRKVFELKAGSHRLFVRGCAGNVQVRAFVVAPLPSPPTSLRIVSGP